MHDDIVQDCELYAKVIEGIIVVDDDWQPGDPERREPRETLLRAKAEIERLRVAFEQCAKIADPWSGFWLDDDSTDADRAVVECRKKIAAAIRALGYPVVTGDKEKVDLQGENE